MVKQKRTVCKKGEYLTLDGKCVKLTHNTKTRDTELTLKRNCDNDEAVELFMEVGESLAKRKGRFNITFQD